MDMLEKIKGIKPCKLIIMRGYSKRAHLGVAASSIISSSVFVGDGAGRGIHDDAVLLGRVEQLL